ncbi:Delta-9 fatty acid desaturase protein [Mycena sanguinolenta]|uniref:L-2-hydroxyglutarate dehydrogenase, mitochondrial n=1 Tax=Mycena sanguinolenta TaxID=230812 RepID=A0A8H7D0U1_9AGAR|nr:Delta-9 fatty acid desaturase protein [Mycena sanguinolenta]
MQAFRAGLNSVKYAYKSPESVVDYLVVGGGAVGLAIARSLSQKFGNKSTILVERHSRAGEEISSRNSEVIHSGLYYPPNSLKTRLCIRGRELLYEHFPSHTRKVGKLVVATEKQWPYIESLHKKAQSLTWPPSFTPAPDCLALPTHLLSGAQAHELEPDLSPEITGALWCPETGIVDSHSLMESLEKDIIDSEGGELVYSTRVVRVDPSTAASPAAQGMGHGWVVQMVTDEAAEGDAIFAKTVINATGLSAPLIVNSLLPEAQRIPLFYARGSYASYSGPGVSNVSHLIYPCPDVENHGFQSLGTHLTLDFNGKIKFGPDLQYISPGEGEGPDFWTKHLVPNDSRLAEMHRAVSRYLPGVKLERFQPDYVGIRPKLVGPEGGFKDFEFRTDYPDTDRASQYSPLVSLLGIESPGLTSCLAIAEHVVENVLPDVPPN